MNKKPLKLKKPLHGIFHLFFRNTIYYLKNKHNCVFKTKGWNSLLGKKD